MKRARNLENGMYVNDYKSLYKNNLSFSFFKKEALDSIKQ